MGRVNKKKIAEYTDGNENGSKKRKSGSDVMDATNEKSYNKLSAGSDSMENEAEANLNNDVPNEKSNTSDDEVASKKSTTQQRRKRKSFEGASNETGSDAGNESEDVPVNGKETVKKARKTSKGKGIVAKSKSGVGSNGNGNHNSNVVSVGKPTSKNNAKKHSKSSDIDDSGREEDPEDAEEETDVQSEEEEYEVEKIVGFKTVQGENYYLVRWKGYGEADDTWEPEETLSCPDLIAQYKKKNATIAAAPSTGNKTEKKGKAVKGTAGARDSLDIVRKRASNKKSTNANVEPDPDKEWEVEKIVDMAENASGRLFRIRWKGFGPKYDTWEPEGNLSCNDLIAKFSKRRSDLKNIVMKNLREDPKKTQRLVNETSPRTNYHNKIGRSSKRTVTKNRVFYGEE